MSLGKNPIATNVILTVLFVQFCLKYILILFLFTYYLIISVTFLLSNKHKIMTANVMAKETRTKGDVFPKRSFKFSNKFNKRGSSPQNSSAQILTARHFKKKCQLLNRKTVINQIRLIPFLLILLFEMYCILPPKR